MDGPSSKETNILNSNNGNAGTHNMDNFNQPAPPPPYQQNQPYPTNYQQAPPPGVLMGPAVTVTQQPGVTVMHPGMTTTVMGNTIVQTSVMQPTIGSLPSTVICRTCNHQVVTRIEHMPSGRTHLTALLLCLLGCWPCICLPYCMGSCQTTQHFCTNCGAYVGAF